MIFIIENERKCVLRCHSKKLQKLVLLISPNDKFRHNLAFYIAVDY